MGLRGTSKASSARISSPDAALKRSAVSSAVRGVSMAAYSATEPTPTGMGGEKKRRACGLNPPE